MSIGVRKSSGVGLGSVVARSSSSSGGRGGGSGGGYYYLLSLLLDGGRGEGGDRVWWSTGIGWREE